MACILRARRKITSDDLLAAACAGLHQAHAPYLLLIGLVRLLRPAWPARRISPELIFRRALRLASPNSRVACLLLAACGLRSFCLWAGELAPELFVRAAEPRIFRFPEDHGSHPAFKTEWWYLTGALQTEAGETLGYQATWFRVALASAKPPRTSRLAARQVFLFHGALTDVSAGSHVFDEAACRDASTWAGAAEGTLNVFLLGRTLVQESSGTWRARCSVQGRALDLRMSAEREVLLHGASPGWSRKGAEPGAASYYASITRLRTEGTLERVPGGPSVKVTGQTWFDHEFGSSQLAQDQVGWDWFSVALDDGTDLMLYALRKEDGALDAASSGTLFFADQRRVHLKRDDFKIEVLEHWRSPKTGAAYPARWILRVPGHGLELEVKPMLHAQELTTPGSTGVTYWEGLCAYAGQAGGRKVKGQGYVELVGYAGRLPVNLFGMRP